MHAARRTIQFLPYATLPVILFKNNKTQNGTRNRLHTIVGTPDLIDCSINFYLNKNICQLWEIQKLRIIQKHLI